MVPSWSSTTLSSSWRISQCVKSGHLHVCEPHWLKHGRRGRILFFQEVCKWWGVTNPSMVLLSLNDFWITQHSLDDDMLNPIIGFLQATMKFCPRRWDGVTLTNSYSKKNNAKNKSNCDRSANVTTASGATTAVAATPTWLPKTIPTAMEKILKSFPSDVSKSWLDSFLYPW